MKLVVFAGSVIIRCNCSSFTVTQPVTDLFVALIF